MDEKTLNNFILNARYWEKRFAKLEEYTNELSLNYVKNFEKNFKTFKDDLEYKLFKFFNRFADMENLTFEEARRTLNSDELEAFKLTLEEYIALAQQNEKDFDPEIAQMLEEASLKYRSTRLESLLTEITGEYAKLILPQTVAFETHLGNVYLERYYRTIYEFDKAFEIGLSFSKVNNRQLKLILEEPWASDNKVFSERLWGSVKNVINKLTQELSRACVTGAGYTETAEKLSKALNSTVSDAARLVVTESAYIASKAQKDAFKELGNKKYQIIATLDNRTSVICQDLDLKVFDQKDYEPGITAPPFHPNCRTTTAPYFDDSDVEGFIEGNRTARDKNGRTQRVPRNTTYKEYCEKFGIDPIYKRPKGKEVETVEVSPEDVKGLGALAKQGIIKFNQVPGGKDVNNLYYQYPNVQAKKSQIEKNLSSSRATHINIHGQSNGRYGSPNSIVDLTTENDIIKQRSFYDKSGQKYKEYDLTHHGNPKIHKFVPHKHTYNWNKLKDGLDPHEEYKRELTEEEKREIEDIFDFSKVNKDE